MDKESLLVNYKAELRQSMSLMEILMVLAFDGAAVIHRQHSEAPPTAHAPIPNPRTVESGWSFCGMDGYWLP